MAKKDSGLIDDETTDLLAVLADVGLAELAKDAGVDIPAAGTMLKMARAARSARDYYLKKKVFRFCSRADTSSVDSKNRFSLKLASDPHFREKVGEFIFGTLDRFDDARKAEMLGEVYRAMLEERGVTWEHVERIGRALSMLFYTDLDLFVEKRSGHATYIMESLCNAGFSELHGEFHGGSPQYKTTDLGNLFRKVIRSEI